ncbi:cobalamin biosynthesis protein CobG [Streptomyces sp. t39]|nr:cobalamin biosynthesis protein CobG [Streptomyces sp. t39]
MLAAMPPTPANRPDRDETPVRDRGDACPGALRLHTADDGALARVRVPAGLLAARQAHALADAAERLGDGALDITSRGNLQLRGLDALRAQELADLLEAADLLPAPARERIRNVVASPLSGLDGHGNLDVQPLVRELDALLCAGARATALSGRFLFGLDDGRGDMAELAPDVMLLAEPDEAPGPPGAAPGAPGTSGAGAPGGAGAGAAGAPAVAGVPVGGAPGHAGASGAGAAAGEGGDGASGPRVRVRVAVGDAQVLVRPEDGARMLMLAAEAFLDAADASGARPWRVRELPPGHALSTEDLLHRAAAAGLPAETAPGAGTARVGGVEEGLRRQHEHPRPVLGPHQYLRVTDRHRERPAPPGATPPPPHPSPGRTRAAGRRARCASGYRSGGWARRSCGSSPGSPNCTGRANCASPRGGPWCCRVSAPPTCPNSPPRGS